MRVDLLVSRCAFLELTNAPPHLDERALCLARQTDALRGHTEVPFRPPSPFCGRFADTRGDPAPFFHSLQSGVDAGKGYATPCRLLDVARYRNAVGLVLTQPQHGEEDHQFQASRQFSHVISSSIWNKSAASSEFVKARIPSMLPQRQ